MKSLRSLFTTLFATTGASAVTAGEIQPTKPVLSGAEVMREMRLQWLTRKPVSADDRPVASDEVTAVLMDWPLGDQTVTVLASSAGDASVYTTGTFGMIGGIGHENARKAALAFVACGKRHLQLATFTSDYSYPIHQNIRFFFVTGSGVRSVTVSLADVQKAGSDPWDLYAHGQQVVTEMRLISQDQKAK